MIGEYQKEALEDFDYEETVARIAAESEEAEGAFLDNGYSEFKALWQKAYALASVTASHPDNFPTVYDDPANEAPSIEVTVDGDTSTYYLTGWSWDSFYEEMLKVFTEEQADELISCNGMFYNYDGAVWYYPAGTGGDLTVVHTEFEVEKTDDKLDITRTAYHRELGSTDEYDPENKDQYETKTTHFVFTNTEDGWKASIN